MRPSSWLAVAAALLTALQGSPALAQSAEPGRELGAPRVPETFDPTEGTGVMPDYGTHPDEGLMIAGGTLFGLSVILGITVLMPVQMGQCFEPGSAWSAELPPDSGYATCEAAPRAAIPFAHILGGGLTSIAGGSTLLFAEVIGFFIFLGGAFHHHPNDPPEDPRPGDVELSGARGADVGLGLTVHL